MPKISDNYEKRSEAEVKIGRNIRRLRTLKGYSQVKIAKAIGITFQQFQKYECGVNRLCVSRLIEICKFCKVTLNQFFDSLMKEDLALHDSADEDFEYEAADNKEVLALIRAFTSIKAPGVRAKVLSLVKIISKNDTVDLDEHSNESNTNNITESRS